MSRGLRNFFAYLLWHIGLYLSVFNVIVIPHMSSCKEGKDVEWVIWLISCIIAIVSVLTGSLIYDDSGDVSNTKTRHVGRPKGYTETCSCGHDYHHGDRCPCGHVDK